LSDAKIEPETWDPLFAKLKAEGFVGIECCVGPFFPFKGHEGRFKELLGKYQFDWIAQIHTCGYPITSRKISDHLSSLRKFVKEGKELGATFFNLHSGSDSWNFEEMIQFFEECLKIEKEEAFVLVHETHRRRCLWQPWMTRDILKRLPTLKVTADLSHWVCVAERIFDEHYDDEWPEIIQLVAKNCYHIHARVGYAEGPQVPDPTAPEYKLEVESHEKWWGMIIASQKERGLNYCYVEPEFGPPPYMHTLPHTNQPVADLWNINTWMGKRIAENFFL